MPSAFSLANAYFWYFSVVGIVQPFLPTYLKSLSFSSSQVGLLLGLPPILVLFGPMLWGYIADRTGRPDRVLTALTIGGCLALIPLLRTTAYLWVGAILVAYSAFSTSMTTLLDSMTLSRVATSGGSYARIRVFGSIGYMFASVIFGAMVTRVDVTVVVACIGLWVVTFGASLAVRARVHTGSRPRPWSGLALLTDRPLRLLLMATMLHWLACMPYHGQFGIHAEKLGFTPAVTGTSFAVGVLAEVLVMTGYPLLAQRWSPRALLCVAFVASAGRWLALAMVSDPIIVIAVATIHGLTFGVFFSASVAAVSSRVPAGLRTSGMALFVAITFGVGALVGNVLAGWLHDRIGGHGMFAVAAVVELIPAILVLRWEPAPTSVAAVDLQ